MKTFEQLNIVKPILDALQKEGYTYPTPIQEKAIPVVLQKSDLLACAQTGTGKTAAFAIPILQQLSLQQPSKQIKVLILVPTRELAIQVDDSFKAYGAELNFKHLAVFGGVSQFNQVNGLRNGIDILIATPGRLLDLIQQRHVHLEQLQTLVLDEADRMLDMGFIKDVKKIISMLPTERQTLFFSATMPPEIAHLSRNILVNPVKVEVTPPSSTVEKIEQAVYFVDQENKKSLLIHLLKDDIIDTAIVFTRTKYGADKVCKELNKANIKAQAIHGNKTQNARQLALKNFKTKSTRVLVATDIAARGIDIDNLSHVINYELPEVAETYVHRIGRTGRAGQDGKAISFCSLEEKMYLRAISTLTVQNIPIVTEHPYPMAFGGSSLNAPQPSIAAKPARSGGWGGGGSRKRTFRQR